jgi:phage regulator Rha-like protein
MTTAIALPDERSVSRIFVIRGKKIMLDRDLAELYGVETRVLTQAVRRNRERFPDEFMFQLTREEFGNLKSHIVTSSWGGTRKAPLAFTEQGVAMLSAVLRSKQAITISILIIKAFVRMRELLETNQALRAKLNALERQLGKHDKKIRDVYTVLQYLLEEPEKPKERMGFQPRQ